MKDLLLKLVELQEIDLQIDHYQNDLDRIPLELQEMAKSMVSLRHEIDDAMVQQAAIEKELKAKEQDIAVEQEKIKKSERRLLSIKNLKEHDALSREIKLGKKVAGEIEESILEMITQTEDLKKTIDKKQAELSNLEKILVEKKGETDQLITTAKESVTALLTQKETIIVEVDPEYLKRYQIVKKARGNAMAEMINGSCKACCMSVPPQLNIRVLKQQEFLTCPNCNRILYVKQENVPENNKMD
ncbi:MAG: zinc ribbon domain-containing protein [Desulfomonilaceae bacterium]